MHSDLSRNDVLALRTYWTTSRQAGRAILAYCSCLLSYTTDGTRTADDFLAIIQWRLEHECVRWESVFAGLSASASDFHCAHAGACGDGVRGCAQPWRASAICECVLARLRGGPQTSWQIKTALLLPHVDVVAALRTLELVELVRRMDAVDMWETCASAN